MNKKELKKIIKKLNKAENKLLLTTMEKDWILANPKLNILNYWWYRYFTNEFERYIINFFLKENEKYHWRIKIII